MSFSVHPKALDAFSRSLEALACDAATAKEYASTHTKKVDDSSGYLLGCLYSQGVMEIGESVQRNLERLKVLSAGSADELRKSADAYRNTEKKNAELMDQIYKSL